MTRRYHLARMNGTIIERGLKDINEACELRAKYEEDTNVKLNIIIEDIPEVEDKHPLRPMEY